MPKRNKKTNSNYNEYNLLIEFGSCKNNIFFHRSAPKIAISIKGTFKAKNKTRRIISVQTKIPKSTKPNFVLPKRTDSFQFQLKIMLRILKKLFEEDNISSVNQFYRSILDGNGASKLSIAIRFFFIRLFFNKIKLFHFERQR